MEVMLRTGRILEDAWNWLARRVPREEMKTTHLWMKMLTERLAWVLGKAVGLYTPCVQGNNSWVASHQPAAGGRGGLGRTWGWTSADPGITPASHPRTHHTRHHPPVQSRFILVCYQQCLLDKKNCWFTTAYVL